MAFQRHLLPEPVSYFESQGLTLKGPGKWKSALCVFHNDRNPSLRINTETGAFACMSCGASGDDVIAFHIQFTGLDFVDAAKALGCWQDNGRPSRHKPLPFSTRDALDVLVHDVPLIAVARLGESTIPLTEADREALIAAAARVQFVDEVVRR